MPRLISVRRPPARPVRPRGSESSPLQHIEHASQCLPIEATADADTVLAGDINLDLLRNGRTILLCGKSPQASVGRPMDRAAQPGRRIAVQPLTSPAQTTRSPASAPSPLDRTCIHNRLCGHFSPSQAKDSSLSAKWDDSGRRFSAKANPEIK
jgi:hypothetical protein